MKIKFTLIKLKKMKSRNLLLLFALLLTGMFAPVALKADDFKEISDAIRAGNAREVSKHFGNRVELTVQTSESICSKTQAEVILKDFFDNHTPTNFRIIHQGSSTKGSKYAIGNLTTNNGSFRTYLFIKQVGNVYKIQELRIEKD
jgi:hypothetical protein